jgi:hypothetical protein
VVVSRDELLGRLHAAFKLRSSEVTERNPVSSRSHAICVVKLLTASVEPDEANSLDRPRLPETGGSREGDENGYFGKIALVDLAGSERNYETVKMTAAMHRESADINFALMALKDCFRAYHAQCVGSKMMQRSKSRCTESFDDLAPARAPFRASLLTRVLRECFVDPDDADGRKSGKVGDETNETVNATKLSGRSHVAKQVGRHMTTIITTVSPTATDLQHSVNSLDHVVLMAPRLYERTRAVTVEVPMNGAAPSHVPIEQWTASQVTSWLATADGGRFAQLVLPSGMSGAGLMQLNMVCLSALFEGQLRAARQGEEGVAWVVQGEHTQRHTYLGRALWAALRRQQLGATRSAKEL